MAKDFRFEHGQRVKLTESEETGRVIGRADYPHAEERYFLRYVDAQGCQRENWFTSSAIEDVDGEAADSSAA